MHPVLFEHDSHEVALDFHGIGIFRHTETEGDPADVGINNDAFGFSVQPTENDIRGFAGNAAEGEKPFHRVRDAVLKPIADELRGHGNRFGLGAVESGRMHHLLELEKGNPREVDGCLVRFEIRPHGLVHPLVRALGRENDRDQELERCLVFQGHASVWIGALEAADNGRDPLFFLCLLFWHEDSVAQNAA